MTTNTPLRCFNMVILVVILMVSPACKIPVSGALQESYTKSTSFMKGTYFVQVDSLSSPFKIIHSDNVTLDFHGAVIDNRQKGQMPDAFAGIGLYIHDCKNVTIKNVSLHGFKIAILAENVAHLTIEACDVSYNYRPRLLSHWDKEDEKDWLYYHHNEQDEWKRYGAAVYLKNCNRANLHDVACQQGFNGLLMVSCEDGLIYNNNFSFNSGLGIGLYRSSHNTIMHNRLDWNARGYSHGQYARGQDSAAILLYEQSSHNLISYNSATHSGDGLFLWAGQSTMDTGIGGCDSNMIYHNDFSHSIANAIEVTFSANWMIDNKLNDSHYGIWGGYSHHSVMLNNEIRDCETGIAIEHGHRNEIEGNTIMNCKHGIQLWQRDQQPEDWPYPKKVDTRSRDYRIDRNVFDHVGTAFEIEKTDSVWADQNTFTNVDVERKPGNVQVNYLPADQPIAQLDYPESLTKPMKAGMDVNLPASLPQGRKFIIINEWGPYNFQYPELVLRKIEQNGQTEVRYYDILGPQGEWMLESVLGCETPDHISGTIPDSFTTRCLAEVESRQLDLVYTGQAITDQFGKQTEAGKTFPFGDRW